MSMDDQLIYMIMDPLHARVFPIQFEADPCADGACALPFRQTFNFDWTVTRTTEPVLMIPGAVTGTTQPLLEDPTTQPFVILRDPVVEGIHRALGPGTTTPCVYTATFGNGLYGMGDVITGYMFRMTPNYEVEFPVSYLAHSSGLAAYGPRHTAGTWADGEVRFFWIDTPGTLSGSPTLTKIDISVTANQTTPGNSLRVNFFRYISASERVNTGASIFPALTAGVAGSITSFTPLFGSGYYGMQVESSESFPICDLVFTLQVTTYATSVYRHVARYGIYDHTADVRGARVLGEGILVSNTSPQAVKSGNVYTVSLTGDSPWYWYLSAITRFTDLPNKRYEMHSWDVGCYTYVKPESSTSQQAGPWAYVNAFDTLVTGSPAPNFQPFRALAFSMVLVVPAQMGATANPSWPTAMATVTYGSAFQFTSESQWIWTMPCHMPGRGLQLRIANAPQFFANETHLSDIWRAVVRHAKPVWHGVSTVGNGISNIVGGLETGNVLSVGSGVKSIVDYIRSLMGGGGSRDGPPAW